MWAGGSGLWALVRGNHAALGPDASAGEWASAALPCMVLLVLGCLFLMPAEHQIHGLAFRISRHNYGEKGMKIDFLFAEDQIHFHNAVSNVSLAYSQVQDTAEDAERFFSLLNKRTALILKKADFTAGSPEAFREFLEQKTGQSICRLKDADPPRSKPSKRNDLK